MRVFSFLLLSLVVVAFCATSALAQMPKNSTVLILYSDDKCTPNTWQVTGLVETDSSSQCRSGEPGNPSMNSSYIFTCTTSMTSTTMKFALYNGTQKCDNTPLGQYDSTGTPHACAPITITFQGQKLAISGHVECDVMYAQQSADSSSTFQRLITTAEHVANTPAKTWYQRLTQLLQ
jgi:hypothetical protein